MRERLKSWVVRASELLVSVALALAFFMVLLVLLGLSFPEGTKLGDLLRAGAGIADDAERSPTVSEDRRSSDLLALLVSTERRVKAKSPTDIIWRDAAPGSRLAGGHAVQTFEESSATVAFERSGRMVVRENSLVVLKEHARDRVTGRRNASVVVLGGELRATLGGSAQAPLDVRVETAAGVADFRAADAGGRPAEIGVIASGDDSVMLSVYDGVARVSTGGRTLELGPEEAIAVHANGEPGLPRPLPAAPAALGPADGSRVVYSDLPPRVEFRWEASPGASEYRFVLSRDEAGTSVVTEQRIPRTTFVHGNLHPATYYWRVAGVEGGLEGRLSEPARLIVERDGEPPRLEVVFPEGAVTVPRVVVRGSVEESAEVLVAGAPVAVDAGGGFEALVDLRRGSNVILVEAIDPAGNTAYASRIVHANF